MPRVLMWYVRLVDPIVAVDGRHHLFPLSRSNPPILQPYAGLVRDFTEEPRKDDLDMVDG